MKCNRSTLTSMFLLIQASIHCPHNFSLLLLNTHTHSLTLTHTLTHSLTLTHTHPRKLTLKHSKLCPFLSSEFAFLAFRRFRFHIFFMETGSNKNISLPVIFLAWQIFCNFLQHMSYSNFIHTSRGGGLNG